MIMFVYQLLLLSQDWYTHNVSRRACSFGHNTESSLTIALSACLRALVFVLCFDRFSALIQCSWGALKAIHSEKEKLYMYIRVALVFHDGAKRRQRQVCRFFFYYKKPQPMARSLLGLHPHQLLCAMRCKLSCVHLN